jgi:hypothetical protein
MVSDYPYSTISNRTDNPLFFRACPTARITDSVKDEDATMVEFLVIKPACGVMEITLDQKQ